jgi:hypothetical protein
MARRLPAVRSHTPRTRDAALRKLGAANRWLIAGSAALTGVFTAVAANAFPGHTLKSQSRNASARGRSSTTKRSDGSGHLRPPASRPESSDESGTEPSEPAAGEPTPGVEASESSPPAEAPPAQESAPTEQTTPESSQQVQEPQQPTAPPEETEPQAQPEAPVVSGGS